MIVRVPALKPPESEQVDCHWPFVQCRVVGPQLWFQETLPDPSVPLTATVMLKGSADLTVVGGLTNVVVVAPYTFSWMFGDVLGSETRSPEYSAVTR